MYETPFHQSDPPYQAYRTGPGRCGGGYRFLRTVLMWTAIAVVAMLALGTAAWVFGLVFHLLGLLVRVALVTAVVAFVWRRITRRHQRNYDV